MAERLIIHSSLQGSELARLLLAPSLPGAAAAQTASSAERTAVCM
jgi:hypothetical protein